MGRGRGAKSTCQNGQKWPKKGTNRPLLAQNGHKKSNGAIKTEVSPKRKLRFGPYAGKRRPWAGSSNGHNRAQTAQGGPENAILRPKAANPESSFQRGATAEKGHKRPMCGPKRAKKNDGGLETEVLPKRKLSFGPSAGKKRHRAGSRNGHNRAQTAQFWPKTGAKRVQGHTKQRFRPRETRRVFIRHPAAAASRGP